MGNDLTLSALMTPAQDVFEDDEVRICRLCGVLPQDRGASREDQARSVFQTMAALLEERGFRFTHTVRTWFLLDHLLDWYAEFNQVRTAFYNRRGVSNHILPASTGVGIANPAGTAIVGALVAVMPGTHAVAVEAVPSPLQRSPLTYNISFSRAVEVTGRSQQTLYVSGTASVGPSGESLHRDDPEAQIDRTLSVVAALLSSRGMDWPDVTRAIAYFKDPAHEPLFREQCSARGIDLPAPDIVQADICRPELVFEIEVDAAAKT